MTEKKDTIEYIRKNLGDLENEATEFNKLKSSIKKPDLKR